MRDANDEAEGGNTAVPLVVALLAVFTIGYWLVSGGPREAVHAPHTAQQTLQAAR